MLALTFFAFLAAADTSASAQREALSTCLKQAIEKGRADKVGVEGFPALSRDHCAGPEADLRKTVMALDMKNGISRKDAAENAKLEIDDYFLVSAERFEAEVGRSKPVAETQAQAEIPQPPPPQQQ